MNYGDGEYTLPSSVAVTVKEDESSNLGTDIGTTGHDPDPQGLGHFKDGLITTEIYVSKDVRVRISSHQHGINENGFSQSFSSTPVTVHCPKGESIIFEEGDVQHDRKETTLERDLDLNSHLKPVTTKHVSKRSKHTVITALKPQTAKPVNVNPFVRLTRLTRKEIQEASTNHSTPVVHHRDRIINGDDTYECKLCEKIFSAEPSFERHLKYCVKHSKNRNRYCVPCYKIFYRKKGLVYHNLLFHASETEKEKAYKFKCKLCPAKFIRSREFLVHSKNAHKESVEKAEAESKTFKCDQCKYTTTIKDYLKKHTKRHLEVKPFKCPMPGCEREFRIKDKLRVHLMSHSDQWKFNCPHPGCNRSFRTDKFKNKHLLKSHAQESSVEQDQKLYNLDL